MTFADLSGRDLSDEVRRCFDEWNIGWMEERDSGFLIENRGVKTDRVGRLYLERVGETTMVSRGKTFTTGLYQTGYSVREADGTLLDCGLTKAQPKHYIERAVSRVLAVIFPAYLEGMTDDKGILSGMKRRPTGLLKHLKKDSEVIEAYMEDAGRFAYVISQPARDNPRG